MNNNFIVDEQWIKQNNIKVYKALDIYKKHNENKDVIMFFIETFMAMFENKTSFFGCRVHCDNFYCDVIEKKEMEQNGVSVYDIHVITDVVSDKQQLVLKELEFHEYFIFNKINDTDSIKEFIKTLIECAFNGFMISIYEKEKLIKSIFDNIDIQDKTYQNFRYECDTCHKEFDNAKDFLSHLKETKHKDCVYQQFGYWEGIE